MVQLSPYVMRTAMMLEELDDESKRAVYMVVSDAHRLKSDRDKLQAMANSTEKPQVRSPHSR